MVVCLTRSRPQNAGTIPFGRNQRLCLQHGLSRYTLLSIIFDVIDGLEQALAFGVEATSAPAVPTSLGIVQPKNGPCGVLAAFQGVVLRSLSTFDM